MTPAQIAQLVIGLVLAFVVTATIFWMVFVVWHLSKSRRPGVAVQLQSWPASAAAVSVEPAGTLTISPIGVAQRRSVAGGSTPSPVVRSGSSVAPAAASSPPGGVREEFPGAVTVAGPPPMPAAAIQRVDVTPSRSAGFREARVEFLRASP
jgi:hypothetical protein